MTCMWSCNDASPKVQQKWVLIFSTSDLDLRKWKYVSIT